jgi:hypothetical protein
MGTVYIAANLVSATDGWLNAGHLQFAYQSNDEWREVEVQAPDSVIL